MSYVFYLSIFSFICKRKWLEVQHKRGCLTKEIGDENVSDRDGEFFFSLTLLFNYRKFTFIHFNVSFVHRYACKILTKKKNKARMGFFFSLSLSFIQSHYADKDVEINQISEFFSFFFHFSFFFELLCIVVVVVVIFINSPIHLIFARL